MVTRRMKIRCHLRSVRVSALSEAERRQELREAEASRADGRGSDEAATSTASPRAVGDGASSPREAEAERAGVGEAD